MSQPRYNPFLTIEIDHPYFNGGNKAPISISPTIKTTHFFSRYGLLMKQAQGTIVLFAPSTVPLVGLFEKVVHDVEMHFLDFEMRPEDPFYSNYTNLPKPSYVCSIYSTARTLDQIEHESIDLFPEFKAVQSFDSIGKIHIELIVLIRILKTNKAAKFIPKMEARSTLWQYNIITRIAFNELAIVSDSDVQFSEPTEVLLQDGVKACQFASKVLIPCRAIPEYSFRLSQNGSLIINELPSPSLGSIEIRLIDSVPIAYSPIFVYL